MAGKLVQLALRFLKKKIHFSFILPAGVLVLAAVLLIPAAVIFSGSEGPGTEISSSTTSGNRSLTYIKPFTSLVGFNWKFSRQSNQKKKTNKASTFNFTMIHL